ncbi:hypothetical protein ASE92_08345 [Pedobacter sp. Leaf41]|uniref:FecR family protein n=1 Tax=Pedobacter sp. Leaf41 TaxID=1736218 RepID=UPI0007026EB0|nr:FecR family protein [Pedobacter sp. Leaf41]KQN36131.1 hypothetical protein ASE92_08345 [Pedobacter sp. Leaf41]
MKTADQLRNLFEKYLNNNCDAIEMQQLMDYFELGENPTQLKSLISDALEDWDEPYENNSAIANVLVKVDKDLFDQIQHTKKYAPEAKHKKLKVWMQIAAVAAMVTIIFSGIYFFNNQSAKLPAVAKVLPQEVQPGEFGATLTMANGQKVNLGSASNGEISRESGIVISKTDDGRLVYESVGNVSDPNALNTLSTARGETYQVRLPDGSLVYLNAASSITYSASLMQNGKRMVKLNGEAYFEVAKDKLHPFIVETNKQTIEVLGTHFNISSYADDETEKTTLLEGSVKVSASGNTKILKPGQQAKLHEGKIQVSETDTDLAVAWKNNEFVVESEHIENIMKMVERWYNVEVVYLGEKTNQRFSGKVSRFDKLSKVLEIVEYTGEAHFKVKGRTVYVSR